MILLQAISISSLDFHDGLFVHLLDFLILPQIHSLYNSKNILSLKKKEIREKIQNLGNKTLLI